jgi:MarR family transcriptional regulator, transcriptional regulator for hemolysin
MRNSSDSTRSSRQTSPSEPKAATLHPPFQSPISESVTVDGRPMSIGALVHDVARLRRHAFDEQAKPIGLTRSQFSVLAHLGRHPDGRMNQSEIAAALEVGKVTLGGLVDRLEAAGLAHREASNEDRRVKRIRLTNKGRRALQTAHRMRPMLDEVIMRDLPERTRSEMACGLAAMRSNLLAMQRERRPRKKRG